MAKYRIWYGDEPEYLKIKTLAEAVRWFKKNDSYDESNSGVEAVIDGEWDEWLDEDDQNFHEHIYMYGGKSDYLRTIDEDDEEDDEDELEEEDEELEDGADAIGEDEDADERLMDVIGGGRSAAVNRDDIEDGFGEDDEEEDDLEEDLEEDELEEEY